MTRYTIAYGKRFNSYALPALALTGALALAACGSSGSSANQGATSTPPVSTSGTSSSTTSTTSSASSSSTALPAGPGSVKIGSAAFPENVLLADIYADAMAAKGVKVSEHLNIGERGVYISALKDGSIGMVPEYTGSITAFLNSKTTTTTPTAVYAELQQLAATNGFAVANYAAAQDSDTITVTKTTAAKYKLTDISDLKAIASKLSYGGPAEQETRADGVPLIKRVYGVSFSRFVVTSAGGSATVNALKNGTIDAADIFSTDPSIPKYGFVSLKDDKHIYAAQNIVPLFSKKVLTQPMADACNAVSAKLDTATLAALDLKVSAGQDPGTVAKAWLTTEGLLK